MVKVGKSIYVVRVGPATFNQARVFCLSETPSAMVLYKPSYELSHKLIYDKFSMYGATTFWTGAQWDNPDLNSGEMVWM